MIRRCAVEALRGGSCPNVAEYLLRARGRVALGVCEACLPRAVREVLTTGRHRPRQVVVTTVAPNPGTDGVREPRRDPPPPGTFVEAPTSFVERGAL